MRGMCCLAALAFVLTLALAPAAMGAEPSPTPTAAMATTMGRVEAVLVAGDRIFIGGSFLMVVDPDGEMHVRRSLVALDRTTGKVDETWPTQLAGFSATVNDLALAEGKLYIGGEFTEVSHDGSNVKRRGLAVVNATTGELIDGTPQLGNQPDIISAMHLDGNVLYLAGDFAQVGTATRSDAAAIDVTTDTVTSFNPQLGGGQATAVTADSERVYYGGSFTTTGATATGRIVAINKANGSIAWSGLSANATNGNVNALDHDGTHLYVGGAFTTLRNITMAHLARVTPATGVVDANWVPTPNNTVHDIQVRSDSVYVGGLFTTIGASSRNRVAMVGKSAAAATGWNPSLTGSVPDTLVKTIAVDSDRVYVGGEFQNVNEAARPNLAAFEFQRIAISKTASVARATVNEPFTYTLTVTASGGPATGVRVDDTLPDGLDVVSLPPECSDDGIEIVCELASVEPGSPVSLEIGAIPTHAAAGTDLVNVAAVTSTQDPVGGEGSVTTPVDGVPQAAIAPDAHDFGSRVVHEGPGELFEFTVRNEGSATLTVEDVTVFGDVDDYFVDAIDCDINDQLPPQATCTVAVQFDPTTPGVHTATLRAATDGGAPEASLTGTGVAEPEATLEPNAHDFGKQPVHGGPTAPFEFTLSNQGSATLDIGSVAITGDHTDDYSADAGACSDTGSHLAPGENCAIAVTFDPAAGGERTATLNVATSGGTLKAGLLGEGTEANVRIQPGEHGFGDRRVDSGPSDPFIFTVRNDGTAAAVIGSIEIVGSQSTAFAADVSACLAGGSQRELAPGERCDVSVTFDPTEPGLATASLAVTADPGGAQHVPLSGTGTAPDVELTPAEHDFGPRRVDRGPSEPVAFTVRNTGTATLAIGALRLAGDDADQFSLDAAQCVAGDGIGEIAPGDTCQARVTFDPSGDAGARTARLELSSDAGDRSAVVRGNATIPALPLEPPPAPPDPPSPAPPDPAPQPTTGSQVETPPAGPVASEPPPAPVRAVAAEVGEVSVQTSRGGFPVFTMPVTCPREETCRLALELVMRSGAGRAAGAGGAPVIGAQAADVPAGQRRMVVIRYTRRGRALLAARQAEVAARGGRNGSIVIEARARERTGGADFAPVVTRQRVRLPYVAATLARSTVRATADAGTVGLPVRCGGYGVAAGCRATVVLGRAGSAVRRTVRVPVRATRVVRLALPPGARRAVRDGRRVAVAAQVITRQPTGRRARTDRAQVLVAGQRQPAFTGSAGGVPISR